MGKKTGSFTEVIFNELEQTKSCGSSKALIAYGDKTSVYSCRMLTDDDPTAHAAIVLTRSMRATIRKNRVFELMLSGKPCPMCVSAIHQANIHDFHYLDNNEINHITLNSNIDLWYEEIHTH